MSVLLFWQVAGAALTADVDDTLTLSDVAALQFEKGIAETLSLSDNAVTESGKEDNIADSVIVSDDLALEVSIAVTEALAVSDATAQEISIAIADTLGLSDAQALEVQMLLQEFLAVADSIETIPPSVVAEFVLRMLMGVGR